MDDKQLADALAEAKVDLEGYVGGGGAVDLAWPLVNWVFIGGDKPQVELSDFALAGVRAAVEAGIEAGYNNEPPSEVNERLSSLA